MTDPMKTASERLDELLGPVSDGLNNLPDDIMQAALLVVENLKALERDDGSNAISIARAIAVERARCAQICEAASRGHVIASGHSLDPAVIRSHSACAFSLLNAAIKIRETTADKDAP